MINVPLRSARGRNAPLPVPLDGEVFILSRPGIRFSADLPAPVARRIGADGVVVFTSLRLVFIAPSAVPLAAREERGGGGSAEARFVSFDVPLASIADEAFQQPVFGANSLTGTVVAVPGGGLPPGLRGTFGFEFRDGGVGTFLPVLIRVLSETRRLAAAPPTARLAPSARSQIFEDIRLGRFGGAAYVDPSDPTTLFLSQPPRE